MYKMLVKFPIIDKIYLYEINLNKKQFEQIKTGDKILIDTNQIIEAAQVIKIEKIKKNGEKNQEKNQELNKGTIIRIINQKDEEKIKKLKEKAKKFIPLCEEKIKKYSLKMKLFDADLSFDEKKMTFYFGADNRVDFRELVLDLIKTFKKMIRLQQIGARDQARVCGGFGLCGRQLCCNKFLKGVESVTLEAAKLQNLSSGVGKISGLCGKLMCCLEYEHDEYLRLKKKLPKIGTKLRTKSGKAEVIGHNIFNESVMVKIEKDKRVLEVKL